MSGSKPQEQEEETVAAGTKIISLSIGWFLARDPRFIMDHQ
jgi:hypothetical protein